MNQILISEKLETLNGNLDENNKYNIQEIKKHITELIDHKKLILFIFKIQYFYFIKSLYFFFNICNCIKNLFKIKNNI